MAPLNYFRETKIWYLSYSPVCLSAVGSSLPLTMLVSGIVVCVVVVVSTRLYSPKKTQKNIHFCDFLLQVSEKCRTFAEKIVTKKIVID